MPIRLQPMSSVLDAASHGPSERSNGAGAARVAIWRAVEWYFVKIYGETEGPSTLPYYCDPARIGAFAVPRED